MTKSEQASVLPKVPSSDFYMGWFNITGCTPGMFPITSHALALHQWCISIYPAAFWLWLTKEMLKLLKTCLGGGSGSANLPFYSAGGII